MLADGVEASVRSLSSRDEPAIRAMVTRIIEERLSDGQFDECDLTLRDVEQIREAFVAQLLGMYHQRIAYPQNKIVELESRRAAAAEAAGSRVGASTRGRARVDLSPPWRVDLDGPRRRPPPLSPARARRGDRRARSTRPARRARVARADPVRRRASSRRSTPSTWATTGPTDVLSFPLLPPEVVPAASRPAPAPRPPPRRAFAAAAGPADPPGRHRRVGRAGRRAGRRRPRRPDRRRPLVAGRRAAAARDPRRPPRLRLGPRRAGRGGGDARPGAPSCSGRLRRDRARAHRRLIPSPTGPPGRDRARSAWRPAGVGRLPGARRSVKIVVGPRATRATHTRGPATTSAGWSSTGSPIGPAGRAGAAQRDASRVVQGRYHGLDLTLAKPLTFMNESGLAVRKVLAREHAPLGDLLVVTDDFALPFGKLRFREGGEPGGHNGLRSIIDELGNEKFSRLRVGIGEPDRNAVDHVLSTFAPDERAAARRAARRGRRRRRGLGARGDEQGGQPLQPVRAPTGRRRTGSRRRARSTGRPDADGIRRTRTGWRKPRPASRRGRRDRR